MNRIEEWAKAIQKHEGYIAPNAQYPKGSRSYRNNNPGNFRCSLLVMGELKAIRCEDNFAVFPDYETGWKALVQFLTYAAEGALRAYKPEMTLYEFYAVYAPGGDGNYPRGYAEAVAKDLELPATTKIKDLLNKSEPQTMKQFHRYGHMRDVMVKVGDRVKKGQKLGTIGTGNGAWLSHLHRDAPKKFPIDKNKNPIYTFYNIGWTEKETLEYFVDPRKWGWSMPKFDHLGLGWFQYWNYETDPKKPAKWCFHPGVDENGKGAGNADLGEEFRAVTDGVVVYAYDGKEKNGGWGKLLVIEEEKVVPQAVSVPAPEVVLEGSVTTVAPDDPILTEEPVQEAKPMTFLDFLKGLMKLIFKQ
jgi:hypothetical protein